MHLDTPYRFLMSEVPLYGSQIQIRAKPWTRIPQTLYMLVFGESVLNDAVPAPPAPYTLHPAPYTIHHTPYTLHPKP